MARPKAIETRTEEEQIEKVEAGAPQADVIDVEIQNDETEEEIGAYAGWIKMTHAEMISAQDAQILMGYNPIKGLGLVKNKEIKRK